jgi:hypothetical protein
LAARWTRCRTNWNVVVVMPKMGATKMAMSENIIKRAREREREQERERADKKEEKRRRREREAEIIRVRVFSFYTYVGWVIAVWSLLTANTRSGTRW